MSLRFRTLIAMTCVAVILLTSAGCSSVASSSKKEPTPTPIPPPPVPEKPTYVVKRGQVVDSLSFTGRVSPALEKEVFFRESGRVKKVYVERDDEVQAGTLLAELENDDLVRQLAQAELELETAQLNLQNAQEARQYAIDKAKIALEIKKLQLAQMEAQAAEAAKSAAIELAIAKANLEKAESELKLAQTAYDRRAALPGVEASGEALRLQQATINYQIVKAQYERALQNTKKTNTYDLEIQRRQIALAELELQQLSKEVDPQLVKAVERSKLAVERLKAQVDNTRAVSPIAGKVTSVSAYEGRTVEAFRPVFIVADQSKLEITAEPLSSQLQKLAEGMPVSIFLSSYPGKELVGKIIQLPYPYGSGGSTAQASTGEAVDKLTHIEFDPQDLKLEPGDLVKVIVTLQKKDDVLWLPPAAIRTFAGRRFVVVEEGGVQRRVDVTIGIESAERVEIVDGLQENQVVVGQ